MSNYLVMSALRDCIYRDTDLDIQAGESLLHGVDVVLQSLWWGCDDDVGARKWRAAGVIEKVPELSNHNLHCITLSVRCLIS
jgi:hypothetical protein